MKRILMLFVSLFFAIPSNAQAPNDCVNAIIVCGNGVFESNATGIGSTQEVSGCSGFEHNSIWLKVNIVQSGTLGFNLIPNDPSIIVDYDFWVYGPNTTCGALGSPIRCCTTNPNLAGSLNNQTGMNSATLLTQSGPGANGNGYVRWLNVLAGQSYYIAIDRPIGDGGFQLQWTGSATAGAGAFPNPPTVNNIADFQTCSSTPNIGIFDLNSVKSSINPNTTANTISFFETLANAVDNLNALPNVYSNSSNPQTLYVRVTDVISGCFTNTQFNLVVNTLPTAAMTVTSNSICNGDSVTVNFTGSPNATIEYTINGGAIQTAVLNSLGTFALNETPSTTTTYVLVKVKVLDALGNVKCSNTINQAEIISIIPLPIATISGTTSICSGTTATIAFTGTPNAIITYNIDSGSNQTLPLDSTGNAVLTTPILLTNTIYNLVSAATTGIPSCSQTQNGSASVSVIPLQTASISGSTTICSGNTATITFNGTPNTIVTYNVDLGPNQTITLDASGSGAITTPVLTTNTIYNLVSTAAVGIPTCTQSLSGSAVVTVILPPTAAISGSTTICAGSTTTISFTGTPNTIVTYTINSGLNQTILLDTTGNASVTTPILTATSIYNLVSVATSGITACNQLQTGSAVVTVISTPTASISGTTSICSGNTATISFTGTPNAIITYTIDSGSNQTITLSASGNASLTTPLLTANTTYSLVGVATSITPTCSQTATGSATITVTSLPTATISGTTTICSGTSTLITFNGTPNATITYTINAGVNQTILLNASGSATLNTTVIATTTYNLVSVTSSCTTTISGSVIINVNALPSATISGTATICSGSNAVVSFLGTPNAIVTYTINGGANQTINLNSGGSASVTTPNLVLNSTYALVNVISTGSFVCTKNLSQAITITVTPIPTVTATPASQFICSGESTAIALVSNVSTTIFSWTVIQNGVTGASIGSGNTISQILDATGLIAGTATYTITPNSNGCIGMPSTLVVTVKPKATVTIVPTATSICSGTNTNIALSSANLGATFFWTATATNVTGASNGTGSIISQNLSTTGNTSGSVTYAITPITNGCNGLPVNVTINVSPQPIGIATIAQSTICSGSTSNIVLTSNETGTIFSWTAAQTGVIGATSGTGNSINQMLATTGNIQGTVTYTITPNNNGCLGLPIITTINVSPKPNASVVSINSICDGGTTDINLSSLVAGTTFSWTVLTSGVSGASDGSGNVINQIVSATGPTTGTAIYSITPTANGCDGPITTITITVTPLPQTNLQDGIICLDQNTGLPIQNYTLETGLSNSTYDFEWFINGITIPSETNNNYTVSQSGTYGVIATNTLTGCVSYLDTAMVNDSSPGQSVTTLQTNMFSDNQTITVTVFGGNGIYLYQLDEGATQLSNTFTNVTAGQHTIYITDTNGCTNLKETIWVVGYPKYFTPNGDGYHDTWNIIDAFNISNARTTIFDRFGKLITQISANSAGWNGIYNGRELPSDDYWFVVKYIENGNSKTFRSHFALKR